MKSITTKYIPASNVKCSRVKATDGDNTVVIPYSHSGREHREAAEALCKKLNWHGNLIEGGTKEGSVFVWANKDDEFTV